MNLGVSKGDLAKGSKALQKVCKQEPNVGEFQGRAEGVVALQQKRVLTTSEGMTSWSSGLRGTVSTPLES